MKDGLERELVAGQVGFINELLDLDKARKYVKKTPGTVVQL